MRKGVALWQLAAEILMDRGNFILAALNFYLIHLSKFIYLKVSIILGPKFPEGFQDIYTHSKLIVYGTFIHFE